LKKSKFSEAQVVKILGELSSGKSVRDVCSSHGLSEATFYVWKRKYAGMENDDLLRLRELEKENEALKLLLAGRDLEESEVRKLIRKKRVVAPRRAEAAKFLMSQGVRARRRARSWGSRARLHTDSQVQQG